MLTAAGVPFKAVSANVDEDAAKAAMRAEGVAPRDLADRLAELKALRVSHRDPEALVLGSDSVVALEDGSMLDKPVDRADAAEHLRRMSGKRHELISAAVMAIDGRPVWRVVDRAKMFVRILSEDFIQDISRCRMAGDFGLCRLLPDRGARGAIVQPDRGQPVHRAWPAAAAGARLSAG